MGPVLSSIMVHHDESDHKQLGAWDSRTKELP